MARAAKKQTVLDDVSEAFDEVTERAEVTLNRGWEAAFEVLPDRAEKFFRNLTKRTRKVSADLSKQTRKVSGDLTKRRKEAGKRIDKAVSEFDKQRQRFAKRAEKRIDDVVDSVEHRVEDVVGLFERSVAGVVRPVAKRLDLASRSEVANLKRRLTQVEKAVATKSANPRRSSPTGGARRKTTRRAS